MYGDTIKDRRFGKGFVMLPRALAEHAEELGAYGIAVYFAIAYHADPEGENAFPSIETIAKKAGTGLTTTKDALRKLDALGIVRRIRRNNQRGRTSNLYELTPDHEWVKSPGDQTDEVKSPGDQTTTREFGRLATSNKSINKNQILPHIPCETVEGKEVPSNTQQPPTTPPIAPPPSSPPKRKRAAAHPFTQAVMGAYLEVHGEKGVNREAEGAWAKKIAAEHEERGAEGCGEITSGCYLWIKSDPWWQYKTVGLAQVYKRMPDYLAWLDNKGIQAQSRNRNDNISYATALAHQQIPDYIREMMEE